VVYEHEGHSFANPGHQRDVIERVAAWFDQHLKQGTGEKSQGTGKTR